MQLIRGCSHMNISGSCGVFPERYLITSCYFRLIHSFSPMRGGDGKNCCEIISWIFCRACVRRIEHLKQPLGRS